MNEPANEPGLDADAVLGERGPSSLNRARSLQSRVTNLLAIGLMSGLGLGLLGWYYVHTFATQSQARQAAQSASRGKAQGDMPLPSLGQIDRPLTVSAEKAAAPDFLGAAPEEPPRDDAPAGTAPTAIPVVAATASATKSPAELELERKLAGPAFSRRSEADSAAAVDPGAGAPPASAGAAERTAESRAGASTGSAPASRLDELLRPNSTPATRAEMLPTQKLFLAKGSFIDCTLETAIDSTLPGMTTCVTATDTFSVDGSTVLMERGTKLVGETRGEVQQGSARVFVLWSEARTPTGVVIPLASPGTDELGRSGLSGQVNRHFLARFGAAILISIIDGVVQSAVSSSNGGGTVIYNPSASTDVMTEVLKSTVNIPPTVTKNNGDRIQVLVARDLDFRSVYELKPSASAR